MKKFYYLLLGVLCFGFAACKKDAAEQPKEIKKNIGNIGSKGIGLAVLGGGSGATIVYNATLGKYIANFGGAELVFDAVPTSTDFVDNDIASVSMSCTNCTSFTDAAGGHFVAVIPLMPAGQLADMHTALHTYNSQFSDYITGRFNAQTAQYYQYSLPNFPTISATYYGTISGVVVRSHSAASTCMIVGESFVTNPPPKDINAMRFVGSLWCTNPSYPGMVFDFHATGASAGSISMIKNPGPTQVDITWSGTYTTFTDGTGTHYRVTANIYHNSVLIETLNNVQISDDAL